MIDGQRSSEASTTSSNPASSRRRSSRETDDQDSVDDILIIKLGALGDILFAEGALRDLRRHHSRDRLTVLTTPPYRKLMERCPSVDHVLIDPRAPRWRLDRMWQLRRMLQTRRITKVYDLQDSRRTRFYYRYLFPTVAWSGKASGCSHPYRDPPGSFVADRLVAQLEAAGVTPACTRKPDLSWLADDPTPYLEAAGVDRPYVVLVTGSSARNRHKRWDRYPALANALLERGYTPVTVPGPGEIDDDRTLPGVQLLHGNNALNLSQVAGVLQRAAAVIGNDSGPTHMGAFLGRPGIVLIGDHVCHGKPSLEAAGFLLLERTRLQDISLDELLAAFDSLSLG
jgi:ADP-heptose:LPS heptosyltransferase